MTSVHTVYSTLTPETSSSLLRKPAYCFQYLHLGGLVKCLPLSGSKWPLPNEIRPHRSKVHSDLLLETPTDLSTTSGPHRTSFPHSEELSTFVKVDVANKFWDTNLWYSFCISPVLVYHSSKWQVCSPLSGVRWGWGEWGSWQEIASSPPPLLPGFCFPKA